MRLYIRNSILIIKEMLTLGIEGTAHTLGIGVSDEKGKVLADLRKVYQPQAGIHPREAAQFLGEKFPEALQEALSQAKLNFSEIGLIAFSQGPGMGACLRTIATGARALALHHNLPLLGVNHCVAHIEIGKFLANFSDPLILYVSGGNTQILKLNKGRYRIFGETLDIGVGNMLDKFGRETGLKHPAGPEIEKLANEGKNYIPLPYVVKGTDLSFSGVLTAALQKVKKHSLEDVSFSLQETSFSMLTEVTERALAHLQAKEVLLTGGVGNNKRLQEMLKKMAQGHEVKFSYPKNYCSDNGVMIALLGEKMYQSGLRMEIKDSQIKQKFRTDEVKVTW